jgi:putative transposase
LLERIRKLDVQNRESYGTVRLWHALRREGESCGRHQVRLLRRAHEIEAKRRQRYERTRGAYQRVPPSPNLLAWPFASAKPDAVWVADITFILTRAGWLDLAAVPDVHTRQIVSWAMGERADQRLASAALQMALERRTPAPGAIHHSGQGSQYTSGAIRLSSRLPASSRA